MRAGKVSALTDSYEKNIKYSTSSSVFLKLALSMKVMLSEFSWVP